MLLLLGGGAGRGGLINIQIKNQILYKRKKTEEHEPCGPVALRACAEMSGLDRLARRGPPAVDVEAGRAN